MAAEPITISYVTGKTVKLAIRRDSDGAFLDFTGLTFKTSGWTTRYGPTSENATEPGFYRATVDPAAWTVGVYQVIAVDAAITTRSIAAALFAVITVDGAGTITLDTTFSKIGQIGTGLVTVSAPVALDGSVTLVQGDDYNNSDGRALEWTDAGGDWPVITGAEVKLSLGSALTVTGTVVSATQVRFELTAAQTGALKTGRYGYDVQAKLVTTNRIVTLVRGTALVVADVTP